jgi:hypothetical protein
MHGLGKKHRMIQGWMETRQPTLRFQVLRHAENMLVVNEWEGYVAVVINYRRAFFLSCFTLDMDPSQVYGLHLSQWALSNDVAIWIYKILRMNLDPLQEL